MERWMSVAVLSAGALALALAPRAGARDPAAPRPKAETPACPAVPEGFAALFDGKSLAGWKGRDSLWKVADGAIVGRTTKDAPLKRNEFIYTEKEYGDFELRVKFRLANHNSGVQVRSQAGEGFVVKGYQADIAEKRYTGILYEEGGRGILADVDPKQVAKHLKPGDWNQYRIVCKGDNLQAFVNGFRTFDYTEKKPGKPKKGVIALQLHRGPPMKASFKDIFIKEL